MPTFDPRVRSTASRPLGGSPSAPNTPGASSWAGPPADAAVALPASSSAASGSAASGSAASSSAVSGSTDLAPLDVPAPALLDAHGARALGAASTGGVRRAFGGMFAAFLGGAPTGPAPTVVAPSSVPTATPVAPSVVEARPAPQAGLGALYDDPQFKALYGFVTTTLAATERDGRQWDKLGQVKAFAAAANFVVRGAPLPGAPSADAPLARRFTDVHAQRALCHLLLLLMPVDDRTERPMMPDGSRAPPQDLFRPFSDALIARASDNYRLKAGDLPKVSPVFTAHLAGPKLLDAIFQPGQRGLFLASKAYCPGAFLQDRRDKNPPSLDKKLQSGHEGDPILVQIDDIVEVGGKRMARVHVPEQHKVWLGDNGACVRGEEVLPRLDVVTDVRGQPVLGPDGAPKPILIPVEHLARYLMCEGEGSRPLDLATAEDRALALAYAETLKQTWLTDAHGTSKTLFDWLEQADAQTPRADVARIREAARQAAFQAVVRSATHPRRTHFKLDVDPAELQAVQSGTKAADAADWQVQAFLALSDTGIMRDQGNTYETDKASTSNVHELAWTSEFLDNGFIGGSLDCLGSSDAFNKLAKTFLEPMGILSTTGIAEGHGASLMRVLEPPDDNGVIQAGVPMKVKPNELIVGLEMLLSSGRGPAAQYMENWGGYLRIDGAVGPPADIARAQARLQTLMAQVT